MKRVAPLVALALTGCQQECELVAFGVGYLEGVLFGSMGAVGVALFIALLRRGRPFWSTFFTALGLGLLGLFVGFAIARAIPCEHVWLHRAVPWAGGLVAMMFTWKLVRRRAVRP